jgi:hypothetical protein
MCGTSKRRDISGSSNSALLPFKANMSPASNCPACSFSFNRRRPRAGRREPSSITLAKTPNLADTLQRLRAARFPVLREFTGSEGFPNAYVMGPDEVKIELQEDKTLIPVAVSHHLHYYVGDPATIRDWYVKTFSLQSGKRGAHLAADIPGMNLSFQPFKTPPTIGTKGRSLDHIGFEVDNLKEFCGLLEAKGCKARYALSKRDGSGIRRCVPDRSAGCLDRANRGARAVLIATEA